MEETEFQAKDVEAAYEALQKYSTDVGWRRSVSNVMIAFEFIIQTIHKVQVKLGEGVSFEEAIESEATNVFEDMVPRFEAGEFIEHDYWYIGQCVLSHIPNGKARWKLTDLDPSHVHGFRLFRLMDITWRQSSWWKDNKRIFRDRGYWINHCITSIMWYMRFLEKSKIIDLRNDFVEYRFVKAVLKVINRDISEKMHSYLMGGARLQAVEFCGLNVDLQRKIVAAAWELHYADN